MDDPWDVKSVLRSGQYVSCMKINGVPLLPPVLSQECRKEMHYYKLLAKETEKRISLLSTITQDSDSECSDRTLHDETQDTDFQDSSKDNKNSSNIYDNGETPDFDVSDTKSNPVSSGKCNSAVMDVPVRDSGWSPPPKQVREIYTPLLPEDSHSPSPKSFTGSLDNIYVQSKQVAADGVKLIRQSSYTVLTPSPQLLAHLEVQSFSNGVDMTSVSISESLSNLSSKKRKNWDLETAKEKWSTMAKELNKNPRSRTVTCKSRASLPQRRERSKSSVPDRRRSNQSNQPSQRSPFKNVTSTKVVNTPAKSVTANNNHNRVYTPKRDCRQPSPVRNVTVDETSKKIEDPAAKVRELYEKIQKQQLMQMTNLIERQKREQALLQQAFEEQNNMFYKQLKTISPKSPIEIKEAWSEEDRGPVSLSQLIDFKPINEETNKFIHESDEMLKKSREITNSLKKETHNARPKSAVSQKNAPEHLDGSQSERECDDQMLTYRTNDTMADLNFTLTDDSSTEPNSNTCVYNECVGSNGKSMSARSEGRKVGKKLFDTKLPTARERAAATTIVAYAKGYLVRRLLQTERVCETVQTIRDALLCALQLHQDKEGIKGADVDLHRRLIQQITAACYSLHDAFVTSTPQERCAMIAADRLKKRALESKQYTLLTPKRQVRPTDVMSQSHSGAFPARDKRRPIPNSMTQSTYETFSNDHVNRRSSSTRPPPWR